MIPTVPSRSSAALAWLLSHTARPVADRADVHGRDIRMVRRTFDTLAPPLPRGTRVRRQTIGGVPAVRLDPRGIDPSAGMLIYLHGGGYVFGSSRSHGGAAARLGAQTGLPVLLPEYRLAPEHPYPAAFDDALAVYRAVLESATPASHIAIAGDSAGGHLTAALLATLANSGLPQPAAAYLISPVIDWTCRSMFDRDARSRDPFLSPAYALRSGNAYLAGTAPTDPAIDVLAADKSTWPPTLIQVGGTEALRDEVTRMANSFPASHPCTFEIWPGQVHVFPALSPLIPEARQALRRAAHFIRTTIDHPQSQSHQQAG
ncbi:alpha/beta hydrolase [Nocardia sp. NPDC020380]|uniref:alpha/beta hydrolase n=1 Tax=Nocardia sp. NPDC020380 TaxID=3364309 RepID=UPI0037B4E238